MLSTSLLHNLLQNLNFQVYAYTVKLGNKEQFDKEQIGIKEPFPVTNLPFTSYWIRNFWH
jgi:hypothetical protein